MFIIQKTVTLFPKKNMRASLWLGVRKEILRHDTKSITIGEQINKLDFTKSKNNCSENDIKKKDKL